MTAALIVGGLLLIVAGWQALAQEGREYRRCDTTECRMANGHAGAHR